MRAHTLLALPALIAVVSAAVGSSVGIGCSSAGSGTKGSDERLAETSDARELAAKALVEHTKDAPGQRVLVRNATIMTATGAPIVGGHVLFDKGRIVSVGAGEPANSAGAHVINARGHYVTPGLIDTHSHLGVYPSPRLHAHSDGNEASAPATAGVWAEHSFWPQDPGLEDAVAGGVTTIQVLPGSANLIGGRGVTLHMVPRRGARAMRFPDAPDAVKMACGENPKRVYGEGRKSSPMTRMANLYEQRRAFIAAREYRAELRKKGSDVPQDPGKDTLVRLLDGKALAHVHCYRADDILGFLQLAEEFGFAVRSFHHALEAYKVRDILAAKNVAVSTWADWYGWKIEMYDGIPENAALVHDAGARAIIHSDSALDIQRLNQETAKAYHSGKRAGLKLSENDALRWVTANPAWALGIDAEVGTLEAGKRADIVIWDKHPFSVYSKARWVFVDGRLRFDRDRRGLPWSDYELGQDVQP